MYPQPRAVHLDDEVYRILDRGVGVGEQFAAVSRPALGLRLIDPKMRVLAEFHRDPDQDRNGHPSANMFDQPVLEGLLRSNITRYPEITLRGSVEVTDIAALEGGRTRVTFTDRDDGTEHCIEADYLLGCDGANSLVRNRIGAAMEDLRFEQRWLVIDVASMRRAAAVGRRAPVVRLTPGRHVHAHRPQPLPVGVSAARRREGRGLPRDGHPWTPDRAVDQSGSMQAAWRSSGSPSTPSARRSPTTGVAATPSCSAMQRT